MNDNNNKNPWLALPFFLVLGVLTVVSFILPLRPTFSESEKRELAAFPEFSVESLLSGDYFGDITLWFSDTFPGREDWISLSQYTTNFHGYSEIAIEGALTQVDTIPVEVKVPETQPEEPKQPEAREEAPGETETATEAATEPEELDWGGIDIENYEVNLGTVIQIGDAGYNQLAFSQVMSDRYIETISGFADRMAEIGVRVISAPCPTSVGIMIEPEYLAQLNCSRQDEMLAYLHDNMSDNVLKVDTVSRLVEHNHEYIYYRTDHHWTALGAYYAYTALCDAAGMEAEPLENFELWNQGTLTGSIYGKVRWPRKLTLDSMDCYVPQGSITMYAHFNDTVVGTEWPLIADRTMASTDSKYSAFLASDCKMVHIVNEDIPDAPKCLVVKDSYGNCYVPYLSKNYSHVYAVDYRKFWELGMEDFVKKYDIDDVIVMPYLIATQATDGNSFFKNQFRDQ